MSSLLIVSGSAFVLSVIILMFFYLYYGERLDAGESLVVFALCLGISGIATYLWRQISGKRWVNVAIVVLIIAILAIVAYPWLI